ncbi:MULTISPECIES: tRNA (guanosine(46)-N7)-methyltransferase TrmB [Methylomonas]|uniref:tRNA (guanine-N(7)-)-methyltransferase n=1 Tax=Methylomonas koyamae TaxID=702114 RepID=A0A177NI14_9GAMM|nr:MULTISPECIES: tRNA (guanosine(46)-N7)-methyltransferase TrmB [Methylomonas]NJA04428.1 tRNA (guanosine(46)-N7)-methyltransferase TrmB [Methylococcaceae bacterium WWC4]OAI17756.1 tRNA (guanine(46)-N(7))-methyltransferase [Methylomonas koyamae]OHX35633.1 tRNA (guanosine(46)-N7)-methyltransferase TrmB [Methylomonas sp. LWB]
MTVLQKIDPAHIKSFIRRQGRATAGQKLALESHWDKYCLSPDAEFNAEQIFGRSAPLIVEIGFGNGDSLAAMAEANPDLNYLGIEVHRPGVGHLMMLLEQRSIANVRIYHHDAIEILERKIPDRCVAGVHLFFPDPWHKRRHHKRRIVRPSFLALLNRKLATGAYFHAATDWREYAKDMLATLSADAGLNNASPTGDYCPRPDYRPLTKFENRGLRLGHGVWDLIFTKI